MRIDLATLSITVAYLFAGGGVLCALGVAHDGIGMRIAAAGLAYITGLVVTMLAGILLLCLGVAVSAPVFVIVALAIGVGGFAIGARRIGWGGWTTLPPLMWLAELRSWDRRTWSRSPVAVAVIALAAVGVVLGYHWARLTPLALWDAWSIWSRKAILLFDFGRLPTSFLTSPVYAFIHPDYPVLVPVMEQVWFRFVGAPDTQSLHIEFWILLIASMGAAVYLVRAVSRPIIILPVAGFIAVTPAVVNPMMSMYADIPMALFLMLGILCLGRWLSDPSSWLLALATLFLAATANTKNEGLPDAICALAVALVITAARPLPGRGRRDLRAVLTGIAVFAGAIAPWRVWVAVHHVSGDMPVGKGLDPTYIAARLGRLGPTLPALYDQLSLQNMWNYLLPLGGALVIAGLLVQTARRPAAFYAFTGVGVFFSLLWGYVINPNEIHWYLSTSAARTVDGVMFVAGAALLHLTGVLAPESSTAQIERRSGREVEGERSRRSTTLVGSPEPGAFEHVQVVGDDGVDSQGVDGP